MLWLSAALSAIAFTLAITVRGELERAASALDSARAYYLAEGAIERFLFQLSLTSDPRSASGDQFRPGQRRLRWERPTGAVDLEITGENGKLDLYIAPPETLARLFTSLGVESGTAQQIAAGIVARRGGAPSAAGSLSQGSSFSSRLPSFLQLEDVLSIGGMTADAYYGWWERGADSSDKRLLLRGGLAQHLTLMEGGAVNVNYASPAVLRAIGVPEGPLMAILQERELRVIDDPTRFGVGFLPGGLRLAGGGSAAYTVRATAQLKGRPVRRTVAALVRFGRDRMEVPLGIARWYPTAN